MGFFTDMAKYFNFAILPTFLEIVNVAKSVYTINLNTKNIHEI